MSIPKKYAFRLLLETFVYGLLITVYIAAVLSPLVSWLKDLFARHRDIYALLTIPAMLGQAIVLETVAAALVGRVRRRRE
jgi:predicted PurR-regulated permease PerM